MKTALRFAAPLLIAGQSSYTVVLPAFFGGVIARLLALAGLCLVFLRRSIGNKPLPSGAVPER